MAVGSSSPIRNLDQAGNALSKNFSRLASGKKAALDDAAGAAIVADLENSEKLSRVARNNVNDASSVSDIQNATLASITEISTQVAELQTQAATGTVSDAQRVAINEQATQLSAEASRQVEVAQFNGQSVFSGQSIQVGTDGSTDSQLSTSGVDPAAQTAQLAAISALSQSSAAAGLDSASSAIGSIAALAGKVGATSSRLASASDQLATGSENFAAAESRIRDVDIAEEAAARERIQTKQEVAATTVRKLGESSAKISVNLFA
jgi:flagellin